LIRVQAIRQRIVALERVPAQQRTTARIIPPRTEIDKVVVVQLTREAEGGGLRAALGQAEGGEAQARGGEGRARVVERLADGAEVHGSGFLKHLHLVEDPKRDFEKSP
jgi:hypothetical protein